ncbi:M23 family metallopeptidase [Thalassotalea ponticola]|uniref:M23 family metallopeptidase n=1 Tax=Thalassotalea ponticola TaxID=1523392 RepID=UPI0025B38577|nr:M23 family metallopeptidase [Thalassotalea ponticola]MDN3653572.1 M23 family metallopeptidase [Thalassotalea ponticola]
MKLSKPRWLAAVGGFAVVSGLLIHSFLSPNEVPEHLRNMQNVAQSPELNNDTESQQVLALTVKIAELQSHLARLNALGERLAEEADIPAEEFNMANSPSSGGPLQVGMLDSEFSLSDLQQQVSALTTHLDQKENQLKLLESLTLGHHIQTTSYLSGRPIGKGWLSSYYGVRKDPFTGKPAMHKGVDFAGKENAEVFATGSGVVSFAGEKYGYGLMVEIDHGNSYKTRYAHNKENLVALGDVVNKGQAIAKMGSTGRSTGPHVHYEILRNDKQINPAKYVYRKPKT